MIAEDKRRFIPSLHFDERLWLNQLEFYMDELKIFQDRLDEIASDYTDKDVKIQIEQFQNRFFIQHDEIKKLQHDIHYLGRVLARFEEDALNEVDERTAEEHYRLEERMDRFIELFNDLRKEFRAFLDKYM
jgi:alpha-amylase/alpha-mannosidase (GH57 family)